MRKIEYVVSNERLITPSGLSLVGQLLGKSDFENVNEFHTDEEFYKNSLGIAYGIPSESSLRNRLDGIGTSMNQQILGGNIDIFQSCNFEPSALENSCVSVDIDVSPLNIPAVIKQAFHVPTRILTAMRRSSHISELRVISATQSFVRENTTASPVRRNFFLRQSQPQSK
jgi:hypothetical protein